MQEHYIQRNQESLKKQFQGVSIISFLAFAYASYGGFILITE